MKTIITKRPSTKNFTKKTISLSKEEFDIVQSPHIQSEIQIFNQSNELINTIKKSQYKKLTASRNSAYNDLGDHSGHYYVVDCSAVV